MHACVRVRVVVAVRLQCRMIAPHNAGIKFDGRRVRDSQPLTITAAALWRLSLCGTLHPPHRFRLHSLPRTPDSSASAVADGRCQPSVPVCQSTAER